jgi:hypothetical protein
MHAAKLDAMLAQLREVEADTLRQWRNAEALLIASGSHDETVMQASRALHREVSEAVKELTDAVRAAQALGRIHT